VAALAPSGQTAPAIANATILPLTFISGIFFPLDEAPEWLTRFASFFPLRPMVESIGDSFNPLIQPAFPWGAIGVMAIWFVLGLVVANRAFSWEPKGAPRRGTKQPAETS
jgi:ABC-2 type transport system permease protein